MFTMFKTVNTMNTVNAMNSNRFILEPYKGISTRHTCPRCGKRREFTRYIDTEKASYLAGDVGTCNRENHSGYHYTPKQFFSGEYFNQYKPKTITLSRRQMTEPADYISFDSFSESLTGYRDNNFVKYLHDLFGEKIAQGLIERFYMGTSNRWQGATVFWIVDIKGCIRSGKIMHYDPQTGKRIKDVLSDGSKKSRIDWIHSLLLRKGQIRKFNLQQCLFDEHQLNKESKEIPVAIVESEKTAIIASVYLPEFIWLACGSLTNLTVERCNALRERKVVLFPDLNAYEKWNSKAAELNKKLSCQITVSSVLEKRATESDKAQGFDLADYLVKGGTEVNWAETVNEFLLDQYEERAAIIEFEAKFSRSEAEQLAWQQIFGKEKGLA